MKTISELLLNPEKTEHEPLFSFSYGFFYAILSMLLSFWIFPKDSSLAMVFLTTISCLYLSQKALIIEEKKEKDSESEGKILNEHRNILSMSLFLFLGFLIAYILAALVFPVHLTNSLFSMQSETFNEINSITGNSISPGETFNIIILNNLKVLSLAIIFSLFYGAGAIFILVWNASMMAWVIVLSVNQSASLLNFPEVLLKYSIHGIPEMLSYFVGALAGGLFYVALIKGDIRKYRAKRLLTDFFILVLISIGILVISAFLESFISSTI